MGEDDKKKEVPTITIVGEYDDSQAKSAEEQARERVKEVYGPLEEQLTEYNDPEPTEQQYNLNTDYLNKMFPSISQEEEEARVKKANTDRRWLRYSRAAAALANLVAVGGWHANSVDMGEQKIPDIATWRTNEQAKRTNRFNGENQLRSQFNTAHSAWLNQRNATERANKLATQRYNSAISSEAKQIRAEMARKDAELERKSGLSSDSVKIAWSRLGRGKQTRRKDGTVPSLDQMYDDLVRAGMLTADKKGNAVLNSSATSSSSSSTGGGGSLNIGFITGY